MDIDFNISKSCQSSKEERSQSLKSPQIRKSPQEENNNNITQGNLLAVQLPFHLVSFSNAYSGSYDLESRVSSLRSILITLEEIDFPFELLQNYDTHHELISILNPSSSREEIFIALQIICYYYLTDFHGCHLAMTVPNLPEILFAFISGKESDYDEFVGPIFAGFSGIFRFYPVLKNDFLSRHFEERIIYFYCKITITPDFDIASVIKSMVVKQLDEEFIGPIQQLFIKIINNYLLCKDTRLTRIAIQTARHMICQFPYFRSFLKSSDFMTGIMNIIFDTETYFFVFKTAFYFLRIFCQGNNESNESIITRDLFNVVHYQLINNHILSEAQNKLISYILIDVGYLISLKYNNNNSTNNNLNNKEELNYLTAFTLFDSCLFGYIIEKSRDAPFRISIQCCSILCKLILINSSNIEIVGNIMRNGFIDCLQLVLSCDNVNVNLLGLDALFRLCDTTIKTRNAEWTGLIQGQDWIPETIVDLCESDYGELADCALYFQNNFLNKPLLNEE